MKKYLFLSLTVIALLFVNCSKDDDESDEIGTVTYLKMKIDNGSEVSFDVTSTVTGDNINIVGENGSKTLNIQVSKDADTGDADIFTITYTENSIPVFSSSNGTLNISTHDTSAKHIVGTFSVDYYDTTQNSHTATGSFDVRY